MKIPTTLKHKPVIVSEEYDKIDGRLSENSDAKGLSLGLAQWNDRGKVDISAKVWRFTGEKWSRQSEELPIHRVLDLAILICRAKKYFRNIYGHDQLFSADKPQIDRIGLQGGAMNVDICTDNPMIGEDIAMFYDVLAKDDELISERLSVLASLLNDLDARPTPETPKILRSERKILSFDTQSEQADAPQDELVSIDERRRELKNQYLEQKVVGGVYCIKNSVNGKTLLLSSANLISSKNQFEFSVKTNSCIKPKLQHDWDTYGGDCFYFLVLEELEKRPGEGQQEFLSELKKLESLWRQKISEDALY